MIAINCHAASLNNSQRQCFAFSSELPGFPLTLQTDVRDVNRIDEVFIGDDQMYDCAKDLVAYHNEKVALSKLQQDEMRDRRDSNRKRLKKGLVKEDKPEPKTFQTQGSYAMHTMTQHDESNYDIDDAAIFRKADLKGSQGADMTSLDARKMVRDALDDGSFKTAPKLHTNCVRVHYNVGYQVDIPVYRDVIISGEGTDNENVTRELASSDWKSSDADQVTNWFRRQVIEKSQDSTNGRQLRRITKLIKKFANSRSSWESKTPSGFVITTLVDERYSGYSDREDKSLHTTMKAIRDRLNNSLTVYNPVTPSETIAGADDAGCKFLRDRLTDALDWMEPLFDDECDRTQALKCWDKVYNITYFSDRDNSGATSEDASAKSSVSDFLASHVAPNVVRKEGGGRFA
ncbi:cyclic GMP-AMP synthase DncV-like nucleotidyltransferase [Bythopirellula goksoeyrii]|uniref:Cyclic GMP-AMP synthase n=1 Tax=Bythopirellula goksoeyrii TaxID=1400387 RepID=A0A5B9QB38_9BACT|nr:hypothetical protein [Bythopirellula goksoeyrii]QEG36247.1 hypothetical protein Pr1d_35590 [Bythopirellula goksoeyrii]